MLLRFFLTFGILFGASGATLAKTRLLVFAAASMKNVLEDIGQVFEKNCSCNVVFSFAGSGALARQIEAGAPADIYISANVNWMDWLQKHNAVEADGIGVIAHNRLIVAVNRDRQLPASPNLVELLQGGRIAMANPVSVPAGKYAKQALVNIGIWEKVRKRMVFGENVRVSLSLVARGDVASAIVYRSDLSAEPRVKSGFLLGAKHHSPIEYLAARVGPNKLAEDFLVFLNSGMSAAIFLKFGFTALDHG